MIYSEYIFVNFFYLFHIFIANINFPSVGSSCGCVCYATRIVGYACNFDIVFF